MSETKTHEPTPRRERKARAEGRVWQSRDLTLGALLTVTGALVRLGAGAAQQAMETFFTGAIGRATAGAEPRAAFEASLSQGAALVLPVLVGLVGIAALASALQVGGVLAPGAIAPDAGRIDPSTRFDADAGPRVGLRGLLAVGRFALLAAIGIATLLEGLPGIATLARRPPSAALDAVFTMTSALTLRAGVALLFFGVLDAIVERALHRMSLRMTRREHEKEQREAEGDAHVRRERDRIRDELAREGDLAEVRSAALVVCEAELAIALAYDASDLDAVPRVVSIGRGALAEELVREAREGGVRTCEDEGLAARLAIVAIGGAIPEALYESVARAMSADRA